MSPFRVAFGALDAVSRRWLVAYGALHFLERIALVTTAFFVIRRGPTETTAIAVALVLVALARGFVRGTLASRVEARMHALAVRALFRGDLFSSSALESDDAEAAIITGIDAGARWVSESLPQLLADVCASVAFAVVVMMVEPPRLIALGLVVVTLAALGVMAARRLTARQSERAWVAYRPVLDRMIAAIGARLEVVANGRNDAFEASFASTLSTWNVTALRSQRLTSLAGRFPIFAAGGAVGFAFLIENAVHGGLTRDALGDAALFASMLPAFAGVASAANEMTKTATRFGPLARLLEAVPLPFAGARLTSGSPTNIELRGVAFGYSGRQNRVLVDVDATWRENQVLVLVGPNGSGKSTLLRLLLGVTSAFEGTIRIGDVDLLDLDLAAWRRSIAYLPQRPYLADRATIREALALTASEATADALRAALTRVALWDVLAAKSPADPLAAKVGALSTGERQRLALARLLASDKPILLLDEPDANLDAAGIKLVASIIRELAPTKRIAIVAHTEELIALGDIVVALENGKVVKTTERAFTPVPRAGTAG